MTGPRSEARCSRPEISACANIRVSGSHSVDSAMLRMHFANQARFQAGNSGAVGGMLISDSSETVWAPVNSDSSMLVSNCCSRSIMSSTRSRELSPSSSSVVFGVMARPGAYLSEKIDHIACRSRLPARALPLSTQACDLAVFKLLCAFRARQPVTWPYRNASDFLVIFELQIGSADDLVRVAAIFEHQNRMDAVFAHYGRFSYAGNLVQHVSPHPREKHSVLRA